MTETSFMKGFAYPRFTMNKQAFIATSTNFRYITLLTDMLEIHPELFKDTSTTLLYILNLGTNYKADTLYDIFKAFIYTDYSNGALVADSLPILYTYYAIIHKSLKSFEPSMEMVRKEMDIFMNNPEVYYDNQKYKLPELKPLFYNLAGINFTEFMIYYAYFITYLIYGAPYQFYNEIGSSSAAKGMLMDIDTYFAENLKLLTKDTQIEIRSFDASQLYDSYVQAGQVQGLQGCLNKMLAFEEIIKLRNREMNKTSELLEQNYTNQNQLSQNFIKTHFLDVMDKLVKIAVQNNPFTKVLEKIPNFTSLNLIGTVGTSRQTNINELMNITSYCVAGGDSQYMLDESLRYWHLQSPSNSQIMCRPQSFQTAINRFRRCVGCPFTSSDIVLQMVMCYIRQKIDQQLESVLDSPDIGMDVVEPISIDHTAFTDTLFQTVYNNFLSALFAPFVGELDVIVSGLLSTNSLFYEEYNDIANLWNITGRVYKQLPKSMVLSVYMMSWLKDAIDAYIRANNGVSSFNNFRFMNYLTHFITMTYTEQCEARLLKIYDTLIAHAFCTNDAYARFINITEQDFEKHLMNSILEFVYVSGNDDMCEMYSIGGVELYSKMLDVNPFNRGYEFIRQMFGTTSELENARRMLVHFTDKSLIQLIEETDSNETIYNVMKRYAKNSERKHQYHLNNYIFKQVDGNVVYESKTMNEWIDSQIVIPGTTQSVHVFEYMLLYAFNQISGSYHDNEFRCRELKVSESGVVDASATELINQMQYTELQRSTTHTIPVDLSGVGESLSLPVLRYVGEWSPVSLKFTDPIGTRLIKLDLTTTEGKANTCVLMFTAAKLDTKFNTYAV